MTQTEVDDKSGRAVIDRFYVDVEHLRKVKGVQLENWNIYFGQRKNVLKLKVGYLRFGCGRLYAVSIFGYELLVCSVVHSELKPVV